jgi:hypothetical protein
MKTLGCELPHSVPKGPKSGCASLKTRKGRASSKTRKGLVQGKTCDLIFKLYGRMKITAREPPWNVKIVIYCLLEYKLISGIQVKLWNTS